MVLKFSTPKDVINDCLDHMAFEDAIVMAECHFNEVKTDEALGLLAKVYYRASQVEGVYSLLKQHGQKSPTTKYLFAKCCMDLQKNKEAEDALDSLLNSADSSKEDSRSCRAFALRLLGEIYLKTNRLEKGNMNFRKSLEEYPFLWSSFRHLCDTDRERQSVVRVKEIFSLPHWLPSTSTSGVGSGKEAEVTPNPFYGGRLLTPALTSNESICSPQLTVLEETPDNDRLREKGRQKSSDDTPCIEQKIPTIVDAPKKARKPGNRRLAQELMGNEQRGAGRVTRSSALATSNPRITRRSSRLTENVKENTDTMKSLERHTRLSSQRQKQQQQKLNSVVSSSSEEKNNKEDALYIIPPSTEDPKTPQSPAPPSRSPTPNPFQHKVDLSQIGTSNVPAPPSRSPTPNPFQHKVDLSQIECLLRMLKDLGEIQMLVSRFDQSSATRSIANLPHFLRHSPIALHFLAKTHFEAANYTKAVEIFEENRRLHPHFMTGVDLYSTALWHLQKELELSALAQDVTENFRKHHQTWCVVGNCFSAQKEHEKAIKFFQRAIEIRPDFPYAYTLLGHEYLAIESHEKATQSFRTAVRLNPAHYNAWFGLGIVAYRQEQVENSKFYFQRALTINPKNPVLLCQLSVVEQALHHETEAMKLLDDALKENPNNPTCRYHRAQLLFSRGTKEALTEALVELDNLKHLAPKEGNVFFLAGKIYKTLDEKHLAVANFTWATQLDPRGEQQNPFLRRHDEQQNFATLNESAGMEESYLSSY